ncbi:MAG TPA: hypothetical protein PK504_01565 [Ferruginibacter sp.]|nr:hypothetical protein [Ferruginibacter sp.]HRE63202.1 hypothetical protein [Ferruginibacter sp.]
MNKVRLTILCCFYLITFKSNAQVNTDTTVNPMAIVDTALRIKNMNPYFNLHVDSSLAYQLIINKPQENYYWFIKNSPAGLRLNKDNGLLTFKADKSYFLSGKLKYDHEYKVFISVQNLEYPKDKVDTSFIIQFYNTEIIPSRVKPSVTRLVNIEEGDTLSFRIQCDNGSFPIEELTYLSNYPIKSTVNISKCGDEFIWTAPFDFVKESDKEKTKKLLLYFIGTNKFHISDTALIEVFVKENINYPQQVREFYRLQTDIEKYIVSLKSSFRIVDRRIKKTKSTRTSFDLASASTALGGTVFSSLPSDGQKTAGKILPSVGVAMVPVKEATAPNNSYEQNAATLIRSSIKRLEYLLQENQLVGERDPDILAKSKKLRDELKQMQVQLIDIPFSEEQVDEKELDAYFNSPKVNKKYKPKKRKK